MFSVLCTYINLHSFPLHRLFGKHMLLQLHPPLWMQGMKSFCTLSQPECPTNDKHRSKIIKNVFVCLSRRRLSSRALMRIQLHEDGEKKKQKTYYDKRWGEGSCYTSVQFQRSLFSMHVCLAFCACETSEIREDEEKMLWSKAACKKVFSAMSLVPITLLFRTHVRHPHTFLEALGEKVERVPWRRH